VGDRRGACNTPFQLSFVCATFAMIDSWGSTLNRSFPWLEVLSMPCCCEECQPDAALDPRAFGVLRLPFPFAVPSSFPLPATVAVDRADDQQQPGDRDLAAEEALRPLNCF
jgi:hypothetical protein